MVVVVEPCTLRECRIALGQRLVEELRQKALLHVRAEP